MNISEFHFNYAIPSSSNIHFPDLEMTASDADDDTNDAPGSFVAPSVSREAPTPVGASVAVPVATTPHVNEQTAEPSAPEDDDTSHCESSEHATDDSEAESPLPMGLEAYSAGLYHECSVDVELETPTSFKDIDASPNKQKWLDATQEEYDALMNNGTWVLTDLPPGRKALGCKWIWRQKFDATGKLTKYKARLVLKGFQQRFGVDYLEIFAPVLRLNALRAILCLVACHGWKVRQLDVKTSFLNGVLDADTEIYMSQPPNFLVPGSEGKVSQLLKAIYGLKQAPRCWYLTLHQFLLEIGFTRCVKEVCLYIKRVGASVVLLSVYVDDIAITGNDNAEIENACDDLKNKFKMTDLGELKSILGIKVDIKNNIITMSQQAYIDFLLEKFKMADSNPVATPEVVGHTLETSKLSDEEFHKLKFPYREIVCRQPTIPGHCDKTRYSECRSQLEQILVQVRRKPLEASQKGAALPQGDQGQSPEN